MICTTQQLIFAWLYLAVIFIKRSFVDFSDHLYESAREIMKGRLFDIVMSYWQYKP
jgi:hypothetical protein